MNSQELYTLLKNEKLLVIVRSSNVQEGQKIFDALFDAGIKIAELSSTSSSYEETLKSVIDKYKDKMLIGAGTILTKGDAKKAIKYGAKFLVSPSFSMEVLKYAKKNNIPYIPGVMTPKEVADAYLSGLRLLKLFPSNELNYSIIKDYKGPFKDADYLVMGGVNYDNALTWLNSGACAIGVGGAITSKAKTNEFDQIRENAIKFKELIKNR